jgi:hypothetical protein
MIGIWPDQLIGEGRRRKGQVAASKDHVSDHVHMADEIAALIGPRLADRLLLLLPDSADPRLRVVLHGYEVRIWEDTHHYTYEIVSLGTVLARGEAVSAYAALERTLPLLVVLNRSSHSPRAA